MSSFLPLIYGCQNYDWGKIGKESLVYDLAHKAGVEKEENPTKPYAELWMGDHVALPSSIRQTDGKNVSLRELIKENPQKYLGKAAEQFGTQGLPFLFKVLSVNKALSLQVHPSKELAQQLHKDRPDTYKDPNHKPEIAIAITELDALSNFRPFEELTKAFDEVEVFREFIGEQIVQDFKTCHEGQRAEKLKNIMKQFFEKDEKQKNEAIDKLLTQVSAKTEKTRRDELVLKIHKQFPYDIGVLMNYLLNYVNLQPGEAFVMAACEPHAYISGNILEVMACSDNVIRGCMTPKYIDKELLCDILTYKMKDTEIFKGETLRTHANDGYEIVKYPTLYEEFWCQRIEINKKDQETCSLKYEYPSIALVLNGTGKVHIKAKDQAEFEQHTIKEGESIFILPESEVKFSGSEGNFTAYLSTSQALTN